VEKSPVISSELENCLTGAFQQAREARHEHLTVEHLLLAVLDTPKVFEILGACRCDLAKLKQDLSDHLQHSTPRLVEGTESVVRPTPDYQRVLQRAEFHAARSNEKKEEVGVSDVLFAILSVKGSHAVHLLNSQRVTRLDMMNYVSHGLTRP
jgi:ATP-dependent Clp protease ATP-binding subunit ClpA